MTNSNGANKRLDFDAIRLRLSQSTGPEYWRSLEEVAETDDFRHLVESEFPSAFEPGVDRRKLLKVMAASFALAGLTACKYEPERHIVPYVVENDHVPPNKAQFYATAMEMGPAAVGLLAESHLGRPTKIEGNPQHTASLGATDVFAQASVLTLWDPDRSRTVTRLGGISSWDEFFVELNRIRAAHQADRGAGLRILTRTVLSPTLAAQLKDLSGQFPAAKWVQYEPVNRDNQRAGAMAAFGQDVTTQYRLENADVIVSLDADFLGSGPGSLAYARAFSRRRRVEETGGRMNRLYVVEPMPSCTGSIADHRFRARSSDIEGIARALAAQVSGGAAGGGPAWVATVAKDLLAHRGRSVVIAGAEQPAAVHALAHSMNSALGAIGTTVVLSDPVEASPSDQLTGLRQLVGEMNAGMVKTLFILDGNPVYNTPRDLGFRNALGKVAVRVHAGLYADETARWCHWHLPLTHYLEHWSDTRAYDGTYSLVQPLIRPLYGARSPHELAAALAGDAVTSGHDIIQKSWRARQTGGDFSVFWQTSLHDGVVQAAAPAPRALTARAPAPAAAPATKSGIEICFRPDPTIWDGSFSNNGWLQELPKPITQLTWDNAAYLSPATAGRLELRDNDIVEIRTATGAVKAPVWVVPGHADESITVHLGYGRTHAGRVGTGQGFDAYAIQNSEQPWCVPSAEVKKLAGTWGLVPRQHQFNMENRHLVRAATLGEYSRNPAFAQQMDPAVPKELSLYPSYEYSGYAWGMAIDLNACIGCGACTIACQAENNISVVGKDQVARGRIMHWIRVDSYQHGTLDNPEFYSQPVPCMHCENAPCEPVCPVGATVHSDEGLNQMVYNRCVGTRYCSNNCPYKVRRFNFFQFADYTTDSVKGVFNPDVTVRSRGVMEKCTYCVQRIQEAKIDSEEQGRKVRDGEIVTACQQVCPTEAIVFGDINDKNSRVAQVKSRKRDYAILTELNTRPRTSYQARVRNANPEIKES